MKKMTRAFLALFALVLVAAACGGDSGSIDVEDARYRLARADLGAGYMTITNTTDNDVTLEGASAPGIGRIELHETTMADDGTMAMAEVPEGFTIASGQTVTLEPGGKHLMLFDAEGNDDLTITLDFGDTTVEVGAPFDAEASAAAAEMGEMDHSSHGDEDHSDHGDEDHSEHGDEDHSEHDDEDHSEHGDEDHSEHGDS